MVLDPQTATLKVSNFLYGGSSESLHTAYIRHVDGTRRILFVMFETEPLFCPKLLASGRVSPEKLIVT
jgi:hypothetical protein